MWLIKNNGSGYVSMYSEDGGKTWQGDRELTLGDAIAVEHSAVDAERTRLRAALEAVAPTEQPYSRVQWRWEQKGAREHHAKVMKALFGEQKGEGAAHEN